MSITTSFQTDLCEAYTDNVTHVSLHTASPGTTGANDSGITHVALGSWSAPTNGVSTASAEFEDLTGDYTHIGLWDGATFRQGIVCPISYSSATDVLVLVTHGVGEDDE